MSELLDVVGSLLRREPFHDEDVLVLNPDDMAALEAVDQIQVLVVVLLLDGNKGALIQMGEFTEHIVGESDLTEDPGDGAEGAGDVDWPNLNEEYSFLVNGTDKGVVVVVEAN